MPIEEVAVKFQTSGGAEYATREEAELHEAVEDANEAFEEARRTLAKALAATYTSAEGAPFAFEFGRTFYYLQWWNAFGPRIVEVSFTYWETDFSHAENQLSIKRRSGWGDTAKVEQFTPESLFMNRRKAEAAHLAASEEYFLQEEEKLKALRTKLAKEFDW